MESNRIVPTKFKHYKQNPSDGACDLYAMIFGFMHTSMRDEFEKQIQMDADGNVTVFFKYFNQVLNVSDDEIQDILAKKIAAKNKGPKEEIVEYHPSSKRIIIAIGLAYAKAMHLLEKKHLSINNKELLGKKGYGKKHGYAVTHQDFDDLHKEPGCVADLILNQQVNYLSMDAELILENDGSVSIIENYITSTYPKLADEAFIIRPVGNHAVLYYYDKEKGGWCEFNNQTEALVVLGNNFRLQTLGKEPIRMVWNTKFSQNELLYDKTATALIKYYAYDGANGTCYDGRQDFHRMQKSDRFYPDEYLIATILNKYLSSQSSRISESSMKIIVLTEEWEGNGGIRKGGANTGYINEKIMEAIGAAKRDTTEDTLILVPFLYSDHHPGIAIHVSKDGVNAVYLDPFGSPATEYTETFNLQKMLEAKDFVTKAGTCEFHEVQAKQQSGVDVSSCGPILTFSMIKWIEEFLTFKKITTDGFEPRRKNLAADRLFQMYINNTQAVEEDGTLEINELMLADISLWRSVFSEQNLNVAKNMFQIVSKQKEFISKLTESDLSDPLKVKKIQSICDFQSHLTELIFINPPDITKQMDGLIRESDKILNAKVDRSNLKTSRIPTNLLQEPYFNSVYEKLRLDEAMEKAGQIRLASNKINKQEEVDVIPSENNDKNFQDIKNELITSKPFNDLIEHMAGSIKWRQINKYLAQIKSATTMEALIIAVKDDPKNVRIEIEKSADTDYFKEKSINHKYLIEKEYKYDKSMRENTGWGFYGFFGGSRSKTETYALELENLLSNLLTPKKQTLLLI